MEGVRRKEKKLIMTLSFLICTPVMILVNIDNETNANKKEVQV
jgi:hypothetical protein